MQVNTSSTTYIKRTTSLIPHHPPLPPTHTMDDSKHRPTSIASRIKRHWKKATLKVRVRKRSGLRRKPSITGLQRKPSIQTIRRPRVQASRWLSRPDPCSYRTRLGDIGDVEDEGRDSDEIALRELPARFANYFTQRQLDLCASTSLATLATSCRSSLEQSTRTRTSSWEIVRAEDIPDMTEEGSRLHDQVPTPDPDDSEPGEDMRIPGSTIAVVYRRHSSELPPFILTPPITISVVPLDPKLFLPPTRSPSPSSSLRQPQPPSEPKRRIQAPSPRDKNRLETSTIPAEVEGKLEKETADDSRSDCSSILDMDDYTYLTESWFAAMEEMDRKSSYMLVLSGSNLPVFDHFLQRLSRIVWRTVCDVGVNPRCKRVVTEQSV